MNTYLITGGTGTLGSALTKHLLSAGHKVRVLARSEHGHEKLQASIPQEQKERFSSLIGAVEDRGRLGRAVQGCDYVIHAAAQKVIPLAEYNPAECVATNITGTINVLGACLDAGVKKAVLVSSDKASSPATLYGGTKFVAERLWLNANHYSAGKEPHFVAVRYGNCWGSQGSVVHVWAKQRDSGAIDVTDPACTRFHLKLAQACAFVLDALNNANPGELWVPKIPSYRLGDLAHAYRLVYGIQKQPNIVGLRGSEKRHESMISSDEWMSVKCEEDLHWVLEPGCVHQSHADRQYTSGTNGWKVGVPELALDIAELDGIQITDDLRETLAEKLMERHSERERYSK